MDANESKPNDVRITLGLTGPDGKFLPSPPTENPNPNPDPEVVWQSLRKHVPEVTTGRIRILGLAREPGKRSVIAVACNDPRVDSVGLCVGERGSRTKALVSELGGEKIDVVRWEESTERFITNLMGPMCLIEASFDEASREARVRVVRRSESQKPDLALRSKLLMDLTGWKLHVDIKDEG